MIGRVATARDVGTMPSAGLDSGRGRRQSVRLEAPAHLSCTLVTCGTRLTPHDISAGGVCVYTAQPLEIGSRHTLNLTLASVLAVTIRARVVNCQRVEMPDGGVAYRSGMEFVGSTRPGTPTVESLMDELVASTFTVEY